MTNSTVPNRPLASGSPPPTESVQEWLASAHPSPAIACQEWDNETRLALIPLGRLLDAVRLSEALIHSVAGVSDPSTVNGWLGWSFNRGPVIHDPERHRYYALVPPGTAQDWRAPAAACLGEGTYLGVPRTDLTELDERTRCSYWAVPMTRPGRLCKANDVLALVMAGHDPADDGEGQS
ncbi:hypothetical protein OHT76_16150 [Streptomyces sp. NBC_00287]|uniref:hypothetical protein n=1 Tax=Streptomyces sp. NBC_00287 TaxID=2975702 RepID=UPI002E2CEA87|nr:hypothetical protein [Streptomyces sp. NBC_00287]